MLFKELKVEYRTIIVDTVVMRTTKCSLMIEKL